MKIELEKDQPRMSNLIPENHSNLKQILELQAAFRLSWGQDLCVVQEQEFWTEDNPAFGQCAITALVVDDYFPSLIYKDDNHDHYWNFLPEYGEIDLDREQFPEGITLTMTRIRPRNDLLVGDRAEKARTLERYLALKKRVEEALIQIRSDQ